MTIVNGLRVETPVGPARVIELWEGIEEPLVTVALTGTGEHRTFPFSDVTPTK